MIRRVSSRSRRSSLDPEVHPCTVREKLLQSLGRKKNIHDVTGDATVRNKRDLARFPTKPDTFMDGIVPTAILHSNKRSRACSLHPLASERCLTRHSLALAWIYVYGSRNGEPPKGMYMYPISRTQALAARQCVSCIDQRQCYIVGVHD